MYPQNHQTYLNSIFLSPTVFFSSFFVHLDLVFTYHTYYTHMNMDLMHICHKSSDKETNTFSALNFIINYSKINWCDVRLWKICMQYSNKIRLVRMLLKSCFSSIHVVFQCICISTISFHFSLYVVNFIVRSPRR